MLPDFIPAAPHEQEQSAVKYALTPGLGSKAQFNAPEPAQLSILQSIRQGTFQPPAISPLSVSPPSDVIPGAPHESQVIPASAGEIKQQLATDPYYTPITRQMADAIYEENKNKTVGEKVSGYAKGFGEGLKQIPQTASEAVAEMRQDQPGMTRMKRLPATLLEGTGRLGEWIMEMGAQGARALRDEAGNQQGGIASATNREEILKQQHYQRMVDAQKMARGFRGLPDQKPFGYDPQNPPSLTTSAFNLPLAEQPYNKASDVVSMALPIPGVGVAEGLAKNAATAVIPQAVKAAAQQMGKGALKIPGAVEKAAQAVAPVTKLPENVSDLIQEKAKMIPEKARQAAQIAGHWGGFAGLAGHGGTVGAVAGAFKAADIARATVEDVATFTKHLAQTQGDSIKPRLLQMAANPNAPKWVQTLATGMHNAGVGHAAQFGKDMTASAAKGAAAGTAFGLATGQDSEQVGQFAAFGATFGAAVRAYSKVVGDDAAARRAAMTIESKKRFLDRAIAPVENGGMGLTPEQAASISDFAQVNAQYIHELSGGAIKFQFHTPEEIAALHGQAAAAWYDIPTRTIHLSFTDPTGRILHELPHAIVHALGADAKSRLLIDAAFTPEQLSAARQQYAARFVNPAKPEMADPSAVKAMMDALDRNSGGDKWIYDEINADAGYGNLLKQVQKSGANFLPDILGRHQMILERLADHVRARYLDSFNDGWFDKDGQPTVPPSALFNDPEVYNNADLRKLLYEHLRQMNKRGVQPEKLKHDEAAPVGVPQNLIGKHEVAPKEWADENKVLDPKASATLDRAKAAEGKKVSDAPAKPKGDTTPEVAPRIDPVTGEKVTQGTKVSDLLDKMPHYGPFAKKIAQAIEAVIGTGDTVEAWYFPVHHKGKLAKGGDLPATNPEFAPNHFVIDAKGHVLVVGLSVEAANKKIQRWMNEGKLRYWDDNAEDFRKDLMQYLRNHAQGKPGETDLGGWSHEKRDWLNGFVAGGQKRLADMNAVRKELRGEDKAGIVRSYRLDRISTIKPGKETGWKMEWEKKSKNFSPSVDDREAAKRRLEEIKSEISPLIQKGGLTADEARRYRELNAEANTIRFNLAKPLDISKIPSPQERKSTLASDVVLAARNDLLRNKDIYDPIIDAAMGASYNSDTAVDDIVNGKNPKVSLQQFYDAFNATRETLRKQFGDTIKLFRAVGKQKDKATTNWATTREYARQFGNRIITKDVPIDNVLAVNVGIGGKYHEVIVGEPPKQFSPAVDNGGDINESEKRNENGINPGSPAQSTLESAARDIGAGTGTGETASSDAERSASDIQSFVDYAQKRGLILPASILPHKFTGGGAEHEVWLNDADGRMWKATLPDRFGISSKAGQRTARPAEYLNRLVLANKVFGDDIKFEGVMKDADGRTRVITSQPFISGKAPLSEDIERFLKGMGFKPVDSWGHSWYRAEDNMLAFDANRHNFIKTPDGHVVPIDIPLVQPDPESAKQYAARSQKKFFSPKVEDEKSLVGIHNLSEENLLHAIKLGGLPLPSIAITRPDKIPFSSFGEISLVAPPELITPSRDMRILNSDAYSPRYPRVNYFLDQRAHDVLGKMAEEAIKQIPAANQKSFSRYNLFNEMPEKTAYESLRQNPEAILMFLAEKGKLPKFRKAQDARYQQQHDRHAVSDALATATIDDPVSHDSFGQWLRETFKRLDIKETEKIFRGFTNGGNRSYIPHTLENVVKEMKKGFRDAEGFNYGAGSVRATTAKAFRSLKQMQDMRHNLVSDEEMSKLKEQSNEELTTLADEVMPHRANDVQGFGRYDAFSDDLKAMAQGGAKNWQYLREQYPGGEPFEKMRAFLQKLRDMPTEYFEAKPRRAVQLQEFTGAVVPDSVRPDTIKALAKHGLDVVQYPKGDNEARRKAVLELSQRRDVMFSPEVPGEEVVYHGGPDIGAELTLKVGHRGGKYTGSDSGALFFTPTKKYAQQYQKHPQGLYELKLDAKNFFDLTNPDHVDQLREGFLKNWQEEYASEKDALTDYHNAVRSMEETASHGAANWATASQYIDQITKAGFEGAKFLERPGENIKELPTGGFEVSGPPVYSYAVFKNSVKVKRALDSVNPDIRFSPSAVVGEQPELPIFDRAWDKLPTTDSVVDYLKAKHGVTGFQPSKEVLDSARKAMPNTRITDAAGKPLVVYHGTRKDFATFDPESLGLATGAASAKEGFFFSRRPATASSYTELIRPEEAEAHDALFDKAVELRKSAFRSHSADPKRVAVREEKFKQAEQLYHDAYELRTSGGNVMPVFLNIENPAVVDMGGKGYREKSFYDLIKAAKEAGHDGLVIKNTFDQVKGDAMPDDVVVAFKPEQIKSAISNSGEFSASDPNIQRSPAVEEQPAFEKWFKGSKVVDDSGAPLKMFHGTASDFKKFEVEKGKDYSDNGKNFKAVYFTSDPKAADRFIPREEDGRIIPVYLNIRNPAPKDLVWDNEGNVLRSTDELVKMGYDGIIHNFSGGVKMVRVFDSKSIRSAIDPDKQFSPKVEGGGDEVHRVGFPIDDYEGRAPQVNWTATDMYGKWTQASVAKHAGVPEDYPIYRAMVPLSELDPKLGEREGPDADENGYDWSEFGMRRGGYPPVGVRRTESGKLELMDGNHRVHFWTENNYDVAPAWIVDDLIAADIKKKEKLPPKVEDQKDKSGFWHGSASGDLRGSTRGLHVGTYEAARQALEASIGKPAEGTWDGTREYGKTKLAGAKRFRELGETPTGYNCGMGGRTQPEEDYLPDGSATFSDSTKVPLTAKPNIVPVEIVGKMTNLPHTPRGDWQANGLMKRQIAQGKARSGYYYKNDAEDYGSISAVVPDATFLKINGDPQGRLFSPKVEGTTTLGELFKENEPEQYVLDQFGAIDLKKPLKVEEVNPAKLVGTGHKPIPRLINKARKGETWSIIRGYQKDEGDPIVVDGKTILDGNHRAMAAFLQKRPVKVVDVSKLSN